MIKEKRMVERNIELSAEFSRYLFEHPEIEEKISVDAEIVLLPEFDKELKEFNLQLGKNIEKKGEKVIYISIKEIRPKTLSRIEKIELESGA
jgi:transcription termination factor NusB